MRCDELLAPSLAGLYLSGKAPKREVVSGICGLQAQFPNNPRYSLRIRAADFSEDDWSYGLVKIWSLRNTIHLVYEDELALCLSAKDEHGEWEDSWWGIPASVKPYWSEFLRDKVLEGVCEREALKDECRRAGMDDALLSRVFHSWGGLMKEMSDRGLIAQLPGTKKLFCVPGEIAWMERDAARAVIIRRYFERFAPATAEDCAAFTGYKISWLRKFITGGAVPLEEFEIEGKIYYGCDAKRAQNRVPDCAYITGFDPLVLGYKDRSRFLDDADRLLCVNLAGIAFPAILLRGRMRARWKKDAGKLTITPFHGLSAGDAELIEARGLELFHDEKINIIFTEPCGA